VNSFILISNAVLMISFKTYTIALLIIIGLFFIPLLVLDLKLDSLTGDLTRIGKFSENEYGWRMKSFQLAEETELKGDIKQYYDVIILGDSFSHNPSSWVTILSQSTSLKVGLFEVNDYLDVFDFIKRLKHNKNLPRIFIYQSVERKLKERLKKYNECPLKKSYYSNNLSAIEYSTNDIEVIPYFLNRRIRIDDLGYTLKYVQANLLAEHGQVNQFKLKNASLFSNLKSDNILVFSGDLETLNWTNKDWVKIKCNALQVQKYINETTLTDFVFLVAPDKTTVYKKYIDKNNISGSHLEVLSSDIMLNFIRLDDFLIKKIEQGEVDIYWPNDTHWSYRGHQLVAENVIRYLTNKKLIKKAN